MKGLTARCTILLSAHFCPSKIVHMEAFFDREVKKLEFVTERAELRARAKRDKDSATQNAVKEEVCSSLRGYP